VNVTREHARRLFQNPLLYHHAQAFVSKGSARCGSAVRKTDVCGTSLAEVTVGGQSGDIAHLAGVSADSLLPHENPHHQKIWHEAGVVGRFPRIARLKTPKYTAKITTEKLCKNYAKCSSEQKSSDEKQRQERVLIDLQAQGEMRRFASAKEGGFGVIWCENHN
jgi:hypothetical protein